MRKNLWFYMILLLACTSCGIGSLDPGEDLVPPEVDILSPYWGQEVASRFSLVISVSEPGCDVFYRFNNDFYSRLGSQSGTLSWIMSLPLRGTNTIQVYAVDAAGRYSATNTGRMVWAPIPEVWLSTPAPYSILSNSSWPVSGGSFIDSPYTLSSISLALNGTNWINTGSLSSNWSFWLPGLTNGTNTLRARVVSGGGRTNYSLSQVCLVDTQDPFLTISQPFGSETHSLNPAFTLRGAAGDTGLAGLYGILLSAQGGPYQLVSSATNWSIPVDLAPGRNTFSLYSRDVGGRISPAQSIYIYHHLFAAMGTGGDNLGYSLAVSSNGSTLAVGAPLADAGNGMIFIFEKLNGAWGLSAQLKTVFPMGNDRLGAVLALSPDGRLVVSGLTNKGRVYLYQKPASGWTNSAPTAILDSSLAGITERFGYAVAVSGDGSRVAVGAPYDGFVFSEAGRVFVYNRGAMNWTSRSTADMVLSASGIAAGDHLGSSLSLSAKGDILAAGAPDRLLSRGAVYIHTNGTTQFYTNLPNGLLANLDRFGSRVLLAPNGSTLFVTAPGYSTGTGVVFAYARDTNGIFSAPTAQLHPDMGQSGSDFGSSLATDWWGTVLLVGSPGRDIGSFLDQGVVYQYVRSPLGWHDMFMPPAYSDNWGTTADRFGSGLAADREARLIFIGIPAEDINAAWNQGAVQYFSR